MATVESQEDRPLSFSLFLFRQVLLSMDIHGELSGIWYLFLHSFINDSRTATTRK
jgi:hypothetical protein